MELAILLGRLSDPRRMAIMNTRPMLFCRDSGSYVHRLSVLCPLDRTQDAGDGHAEDAGFLDLRRDLPSLQL